MLRASAINNSKDELNYLHHMKQMHIEEWTVWLPISECVLLFLAFGIAPTEGYEDAIVVPEITADNFELKHGLLTLVQNKQFFRHDKEDPHAHIRYFNKITSTLKFPNVPNTSIKLMLFPFSLEALADLGASINLMTFSVWKRLSLPDLTPTYMTLELADRSISRLVGVAEDVYVKVGELTLRVGKEAITFNLDQTSSDFLREEVDAFLAIEDEPTSSEFHQSYLDPEGDILLLEAFLNDDPSLPPLIQRNYMPKVRKELKICEAKSDKSSVDEPPMVELKALPPHLEYAFLEGDDKLPVIITKDLSVEEKTALITVLKSHKRAIA
nr:reverse transcriptase domain-containing protein [Tanacetum cinerariifolium]